MSLKVSFTFLFAALILVAPAQDDGRWDQVLREVGVELSEPEEVPASGAKFKENAELEAYLQFMDSVDRAQFKPVGFRIQIYSGSGPTAKKEALTAQSDFLKYYAKFPSYTQFSTPNWVLRVGDFRTRLEALEFHNEIRAKYPASFIIKDNIRVYKQ